PLVGAGKLVSGSVKGAMLVGLGLTVARFLMLEPPTTPMLPAAILAVPLACRATAELESTSRTPGVVSTALLETLTAPLAVPFITWLDWMMLTLTWPPLAPKLPLPP